MWSCFCKEIFRYDIGRIAKENELMICLFDGFRPRIASSSADVVSMKFNSLSFAIFDCRYPGPIINDNQLTNRKGLLLDAFEDLTQGLGVV